MDTRCKPYRHPDSSNYQRTFRCWLFGHDPFVKAHCCQRLLICSRCYMGLGEPWSTAGKCPQEWDVTVSADTADFNKKVADAIEQFAKVANLDPFGLRTILPHTKQ